MDGLASRPVATFIGLGANLGDAHATLTAAIAALSVLIESRVVAASSVYRSAPVDADGPDFLNAVVHVETRLSPTALLAELQAVERSHGRERPFRNAPRTLDLDLLLYGAARIELPGLTVPHPRLVQRAFVLLPLAELAPDLSIPGRGRVADLLAGVAEQRIDKLPA